MEKTMHVSVAEFSVYPSGRFDADGSDNGTRFRKEILAPKLRAALQSGAKVIVSLANVMSFGSSFLEEAFGGLVRVDKFTKSDLKKHLLIDSGAAENERYKDAILRYIDKA